MDRGDRVTLSARSSSMAEHSSSSSADRAVKYTRCARAEQTDDEELEQIDICGEGGRTTSDSRSRSRSRSQSRDNNTTDGDQSETELTSLVVNGPMMTTMLPMYPVSSTTGNTSLSSSRFRTPLTAASTAVAANGAPTSEEDYCQRRRLIDSSIPEYARQNSSTSGNGRTSSSEQTSGRPLNDAGDHTSKTSSAVTTSDLHQHHQQQQPHQPQQPSLNSIVRNSLACAQHSVVAIADSAAEQHQSSRMRRPTGQSVRSSVTVGPLGSARTDVLSHWSMGGVFGGYINRGHTIEPTTPRHIRRQRRKEIARTFGGIGKRRFDAHSGAGFAGGGASGGSCGTGGGGTADGASSTGGSESRCCRWSLVFDPAGRLAYWWSFVVSIAFIYNFWVLVYRFAFHEIDRSNIGMWFALDYTADLLYALDIAFNFRTGYLDDGVLQTDGTKLRIHYMNSTIFYVDCLCLLPLDFLYLSIGFQSMLRCFRLVKIYRFWAFLDRTERHTNYPNVVRTITLLHYLFAIYHWNACLLQTVTKNMDNRDEWALLRLHRTKAQADATGAQSVQIESELNSEDVVGTYLRSLYWSTLALTTVGGLPVPRSREEYVLVIIEFVFGLLLFATILGHVANIVTSISAARKEFQAKLDSIKTYMMLRRVPLRLQDRVIKWFDYLWLSKKSSDEEKTLSLLPNKLKAEIALHVHLDTLKRVEIFQNTEAGFLCDLVLRLRPVLFSPGDFICRKGEVGKEMYIVNRGRLQVVADNGRTVLATLRPGSYFGEISILNMGNAGNRRTASVRSVGYSDLFCLSKNDLWEVLKDYPTARVRLEAIAIKRLEKYKKAPLEQENGKGIRRSKSTPGMVESSGKVPLEIMLLRSFNYAPSSQAATTSKLGATDKNTSAVTDKEDDDVVENDDDEERNALDESRRRMTVHSVDPTHDVELECCRMSVTPKVLDVPEMVDRRRSSVPAVQSSTSSSLDCPRFSEPFSRMAITASSDAINSTAFCPATPAATTTSVAKSPTYGSSSNDRAPSSSRSSTAASPSASPVWTVTRDVPPSPRHHQHASRRHHQHHHHPHHPHHRHHLPSVDARSRTMAASVLPTSTPSALMPDSGYCLQPSPLIAAPVPVYTSISGGAAAFSCLPPPHIPSPFCQSSMWPPATDQRTASPVFHRPNQSPSSSLSPSSVVTATHPQFYSPFPIVSPVTFLHHHNDPAAAVAAFNYVQPSAAMIGQLSYPQHYHHQQQPHQLHHQQHSTVGLLSMPPYHPGLASSTSVLTGLGAPSPTSEIVDTVGELVGNTRQVVTVGDKDPSQDLLREITRLRSSLQTLESENASLTVRLNEQQSACDEMALDIVDQAYHAELPSTVPVDSGGSDHDDVTFNSDGSSSDSDHATSVDPSGISKESVI